MKVLVTGATGRVGANLIKKLVDEGNKVKGFVLPNDLKINKLQDMDVEIVKGDLTDYFDKLGNQWMPSRIS